jgi:choline kinase
MLAGSGSLYAANTSGLPWYDVDTPADLVAAAQYLQPEWFSRGEGIEA